MNIDEIGEYLEHQGLNDDDIDDFLEHFGVKGMRWGVRKVQYNTGQVRNKRTTGSKLTILGGAIAGGAAASAAANAMGKKLADDNIWKGPASILAGAAGSISGARAARKMVDNASGVNPKQLGLKGKHLGEKGLTRNEKLYTGYQAATALGILALGVVVKKAAEKQL